MAEPSIMTGSSFYLWIMSVVLVFSIEQWRNSENISEKTRLWGSALITLVSHSGEGFLCKPIFNKMILVSDSFSGQMIDMYIVRKT